MSSDKAPEKLFYVISSLDPALRYPVMRVFPGDAVVATYIRQDLTLDAKLQKPGSIIEYETEKQLAEMRKTVGGNIANMQRRREMFEEVYLSCLSNMANDQLSDAVFNNKVEAQTEELLKRADKFAWGEE